MRESAGIIARVSTGRQLDNTSPDEQLRRCREYCQSKRYHVRPEAERVEAISGAFVLARSEFNDLLNMAADGKLAVIVADIPDRLGRGDTISQLEILAKLNGARIEYARPGRDTTTVEGYIQHSAEQMVSGIERMNIGRRSREGKQAWARAGRIIPGPYRTYGYDVVSQYDERGRKVSCALAIREEAAIVRAIFEACVYENLSSYAIARRLTGLGIPTLCDGERLKKNKRLKQWNRSSVFQMLTNPTYKGQWQFGKREVKRLDTPDRIRHRVRFRGDDEIIAVKVPAIVLPALWQSAQVHLEANRKKGHKPTRYQYLLRSRVRCVLCGTAMSGNGRPNGDGTAYRSYRCRHSLPQYVNGNHCPARSLNAARVESDVWRKLEELMQDESTLFEKVEADREEAAKTHRTLQAAIAALEAQNQKDQARLNRYLELYGDGGMDKETYQAKKAEIESEIEKRHAKRAELEERLKQRKPLLPDVEAELRRLRRATVIGMQSGTFEERVRLLDILNIECLYDDRTGEITLTGALGVHTLAVKSLHDEQCATSIPLFAVLPVHEPRNLAAALFNAAGAPVEVPNG